MSRNTTNYIVVHCSATGENQDIGKKEITEWHKRKGYKTIGYHFVIRRNGEIEPGRDIEAVGAHVLGFNHNSVGVCLVGGVDANDVKKAVNNFTPQQFNTLHSLLKSLKKIYPFATIQGHRDFHGVKKACPCFDVKEWVKGIGV